jgi:membrane protease YdiL (CAAX protease family)
MSAMKQLYTAQTTIEADKLRRFLATRGIEVEGTGVRSEGSASPTEKPESALAISVAEDDVAEAQSLLDEFLQAGTEHVTDDSHVRQRAKWKIWIEVIVVLGATLPLFGGHSLIQLMLWYAGLNAILPSRPWMYLFQHGLEIPLVLAAIYFSGESWATFGIRKPNFSVDVLTGCLTSVVDRAVSVMGVDLFLDVLKQIYGERFVYQLSQRTRELQSQDEWGFLWLLLVSISIALSEELLFRGYLIPSLERLLGSAWLSVLVSAAIFGAAHWSQESIIVWYAFLGGLVYGISFVWTRRLWPTVIAHATADFAAMLYLASWSSRW